MKFLTLAVLVTSIFSNFAHADLGMSTQKASGVAGVALGTSASPTLFVMAMKECMFGSDGDSKSYACAGAMTTAPVSSTVLFAVLKEDVQQVEPDAYNFMAGEEISLALEEQINKMRETFPALQDASDEYITAVMLELI